MKNKLKQLKWSINNWILDVRYYYATRTAIREYERRNERKRVFIILDEDNRLTLLDRQTFRFFKRINILDRDLFMKELRSQSIFYYPAYPDDVVYYDSIMQKKKEIFKDVLNPKIKWQD